jgi:uncharacterized membrane protein YoaK (UPF0700 family)
MEFLIAVISLISLICFFVLVHNVSLIRRDMETLVKLNRGTAPSPAAATEAGAPPAPGKKPFTLMLVIVIVIVVFTAGMIILALTVK